MNELNWRQAVEQAEHYKAIGQADVYLYGGNDDDYPWEYASKVEEGGSHRLDISTNVRFSADHPSGITFRWTFDIEPHSANGSGSYQIDTKAIEGIFPLMPEPAQRQFAKYLATCAEKVAGRGREFMQTANRQLAEAETLARLAQLSA